MWNRLRKHYVLSILLLSGLFPSCSSYSLSSDKDRCLTICIPNDPLSLDPRCVYLKKDVSLAKALYEGLVREVIDQHVILGMAKSYRISKDGLVYTFKLKDSFWSNGDPVTAYDFEESLKQIHSKNLPITYHTLLYNIKNSEEILKNNLPVDQLGIKAVDDKTLEITLENPFNNFIETISNPLFFPVHSSQRCHSSKEDTPSIYISNGPFTLAEFQTQQYLKLEKNPFYYDSHKVKTHKILFQVIANSYTAAKCFKYNMIDIIGSPWISQLPQEILLNTPEERKHSYSVYATSVLVCNQNKPILQNKALRQALSLAIDKEALVSILNSARVAHSLIPSEISELSPSYLTKSQREEKAREYFAEAKATLSEKDLAELSLIYPRESHAFSVVVQEIQQQLKNVLDFHLPIVGIEYFCFLNKRNQGDYYLSMATWIAEYCDARNFLTVIGNTENNHQLGDWRHPEFDFLLKKYKNQKFTKKDQKKAEELIHDEIPIIPLYHLNYTYLANSRVKNLYASPLGHVDLKEVEISPKKK